MPIYEYRCSSCGHIFDLFWKEKDYHPVTLQCPKCHATAIKIFSAPNFQFSQYLKELGEDKFQSY